MGRRLVASVHVAQDDGSVHVYQAGDEPSSEDAKRITNEKAWDGPAEQQSASSPRGRAQSR